MKNQIQMEQFYNHPITAVWHAITDAKALSDWFIEADFQAKVGYAYKFRHDETVISGSVQEAVAPNRLVYTWRVDDIPVDTVVAWDLTEKDGGTLLKLAHTGIDQYGNSAPDMFKNFDEGWVNVVSELAKFLGKQETDVQRV